MSVEDKVGHSLKGIAEDVYNFLVTKENLNTPIFRQQCREFEALKTWRILPKFGRLDNVPTVESMDVAACEDIPFLVCRYGADLELRDCEDRTALFHAAALGHVAVVQLLVDLGVNINWLKVLSCHNKWQ
ncbi:hypothetical protein HPB51_006388 [Rhipicephalus microplus]|uniref:Uncharacterized protein n=1 Tax=Rhipicephalus microplus TaxID=6941 RepID=A0A9J6DM14_RHIMP|nr:hypothetical protein HPB51_006388 [Rhipicephalus microplus]